MQREFRVWNSFKSKPRAYPQVRVVEAVCLSAVVRRNVEFNPLTFEPLNVFRLLISASI